MRSSLLPNLTSYQLLILASLDSGTLSGKQLRTTIKSYKASLGSFAGTILKMEREGLVSGEYVMTPYRIRHYSITIQGRRELKLSLEFNKELLKLIQGE